MPRHWEDEDVRDVVVGRPRSDSEVCYCYLVRTKAILLGHLLFVSRIDEIFWFVWYGSLTCLLDRVARGILP